MTLVDHAELLRLEQAALDLKKAPMLQKPILAEVVGREVLAALNDLYSRIKRIESNG